MIPFIERAEDMGLDIDAEKMVYSYTDKHCHIVYRPVSTPQYFGESKHPTDNFVLPYFAIFTANPTMDLGDPGSYMYCGKISNVYKFVGNEVLNGRIRNSVESIGIPILREHTILSYDRCQMRNEITIQNGQNVAQVGDVLPVMVVNNSYNGTRAATIAFAISTAYSGSRYTFAFKLGELRMVHIESSSTTMTSAVDTYMGVFSENIAEYRFSE